MNHAGRQSKLQQLIKSNPNFKYIENGKIKCTLTGHQFLPTIHNYQQYIKSKSYLRGLESQFSFEEYEPIIVPHHSHDKFLYCQLTGAKIPKRKSAFLKHIEGRKFKRRYALYLKDKEKMKQGQQGEFEEELYAIQAAQCEQDQQQQKGQEDNEIAVEQAEGEYQFEQQQNGETKVMKKKAKKKKGKDKRVEKNVTAQNISSKKQDKKKLSGNPVQSRHFGKEGGAAKKKHKDKINGK